MSSALNEIRVVEICNTIAGPACTRLLADFGAEVIKIEPPEGDSVRQIGPKTNGVSLYATSILRNKRSIVLDLKQSDGVNIAKELLARADILVENNRPGVLERLGLDYETISTLNPKIIYVRISGYGQTGPYTERPGYGAICEAVGGVRHMTGRPDLPPDRVALATTDYLTSVYAAFGALAALRERDQTGRGQIVDVALYETAFTQMEPNIPAYDKLKLIPTRQGPNLPAMAPNSLYATKDGKWVLIAANSDRTFARLAAAIDRPDLINDQRFKTVFDRGQSQNAIQLNEIIESWSRQFEASTIERIMLDGGIPSSRIYTIEDIWTDPHFSARKMLQEIPHPILGSITQIGIVPKLSATPGSIRHAGPELGEDTDFILYEILNKTKSEVAAIREAGITAPS